MAFSKTTKLVVVSAALLVLGVGVYFGFGLVSKVLAWRHLDETYEEEFLSPAVIAPELKGQKLLFHIKTGLDQDDSQICVGFNVIFASIEAGADVRVLFDAGALLDLTAKRHNLASTGVPLRLKKVIASQMGRPLEQMPSSYKQYLELLHRSGAEVFANTAMLIVTGNAEKVQHKLPGYEFVESVSYARVAQLIAEADAVVVY